MNMMKRVCWLNIFWFSAFLTAGMLFQAAVSEAAKKPAAETAKKSDPEKNSGPNREPKGATSLASNEMNPNGRVNYDQGNQTDWYQVQVPEKGTFTYAVRQETEGTRLVVEIYYSPKGYRELETTPLKTFFLVKKTGQAFTIQNAQPGSYYAKIYVENPGDASSYKIANTFQTPLPTPTPTFPATPAPDGTPTAIPTPVPSFDSAQDKSQEGRPTPVPSQEGTPTPAPTFTPASSPTPTPTPEPTPVPTPTAVSELLPELPQRQGKVYAVIIGIGNYQDGRIPVLPGMERNAQGVYEVFTDPLYGRIPKEQIKLLLGQEATTRNLKKILGKWLRQQVSAEDAIIIYYSGQHAFEADERYWVTSDAASEDWHSTALRQQKLLEMLQRLKAKNLLLFLDAAALPGKDGVPAGQSGMAWKELAGAAGRAIISAADGQSPALEPKTQQTVFTYALVEGLKGAADENRDGVIESTEIWNYVKSQAEKAGTPQLPELHGELPANLPLTFNVPGLLEKQKTEVSKNRMTTLYQAGSISATQYQKALHLFEIGGKDQILEDFLAEKIPLEMFEEIF